MWRPHYGSTTATSYPLHARVTPSLKRGLHPPIHCVNFTQPSTTFVSQTRFAYKRTEIPKFLARDRCTSPIFNPRRPRIDLTPTHPPTRHPLRAGGSVAGAQPSAAAAGGPAGRAAAANDADASFRRRGGLPVRGRLGELVGSSDGTDPRGRLGELAGSSDGTDPRGHLGMLVGSSDGTNPRGGVLSEGLMTQLDGLEPASTAVGAAERRRRTTRTRASAAAGAAERRGAPASRPTPRNR
eukprot:gene15657-biopygen4561